MLDLGSVRGSVEEAWFHCCNGDGCSWAYVERSIVAVRHGDGYRRACWRWVLGMSDLGSARRGCGRSAISLLQRRWISVYDI